MSGNCPEEIVCWDLSRGSCPAGNCPGSGCPVKAENKFRCTCILSIYIEKYHKKYLKGKKRRSVKFRPRCLGSTIYYLRKPTIHYLELAVFEVNGTGEL